MTVKIHHLNCGTMCPYCERLLTGKGGMTVPARFVCHCLLVETKKGLILVDTGLGRDDVRDAKRRMGRGFVAMMRPRLRLEETAFEQIRALGLKPEKVKHIVPTHLDLDHAGGLSDFPEAKVHVLQEELDQITNPDLVAALRFRKAQFAHGPDWQVYQRNGAETRESWFGLDAIRILPEMGVQMYLVPLIGHTRGHCGVAIRTGDRWLLHCGDSYFHVNQIRNPGSVPVGILVFEKLVQTMPSLRAESLAKLVRLFRDHGHEIDLFCAHDPGEFAELAG